MNMDKVLLNKAEIIPLSPSLWVFCFFYVFSSCTHRCQCSTEYMKLSESLKNISSFHLSLSLSINASSDDTDKALKNDIWKIHHVRKNTPYAHIIYLPFLQ